jgi:hypothetical protein
VIGFSADLASIDGGANRLGPMQMQIDIATEALGYDNPEP